jgi:uncharacterized protein YecE (DUF72 family)
MDFGKLNNVDNVDFTLPPDAPKTAEILRGLPARTHPPHVYIGATGWGMKEWVGTYYPKGTKATDYLQAYGKQFNSIELNTTHYRIPSTTDIQKWKNDTPPDFRFAPKLLQSVSHERNLGLSNTLTQQFCAAIEGLEEKLGVCFMQLPPYFGTQNLPILERFLKQFPQNIPLAIEIRYEDIFSNKKNTSSYLNILEQNNTFTVITDVAGRRDVLHQGITGKTVIIRFIGNDLHPTDYTRIDAWVLKLKEWFDMGLHDVYFFIHEPENTNVPILARYLATKIKGNFNAILTEPMSLITTISAQISLF